MYGSQYLHESIPGVPSLPGKIEHIFKGTINGYRGKVYGTEWDGIVSPERYTGESYVWDIRHAYDWLWDTYQSHIIPFKLNGELAQTQFLIDSYDMVFCTIPKHLICTDPDHKFESAEVFCVGDAPDLGISSPIPCPDNKVICSGDREDSWYRVSRIFGHSTCEWSAKRTKPPIKGVVSVRKPTQNSCDCWPSINFLGRFGEWRKGVLSHNAYDGAVKALRRFKAPVA